LRAESSIYQVNFYLVPYVNCKLNSFALIGGYVDTACADRSGVRSQWQIVLSNAYDKKCKVLVAMGHHISAIHYGRLSAVLDTGTYTHDLLILTQPQSYFYLAVITHYCCYFVVNHNYICKVNRLNTGGYNVDLRA